MNPQHFYLHRISPFIIRFSEHFGLRWYGMSYVAGFVAGLFILRRLSRMGRLKLSLPEIDLLITYLVVGVLVGGRVGYVLFYEPGLFIQFTARLPFWGMLAINQGGMSSHGGFLGVILVIFYFARRHKVPALHVGDAVVMAAPAGLLFGRIANFINGELYGRPADIPWAVCFPTEIMNWPEEKISHLTKLLSEKGFFYSDIVQIISAIRNNDAVAALVHPLLTPRHPSQLYEAALEGLVLFAILWWFGLKKSRRDGQVAAMFFWCYGVMRIFVEQFREPDAGIGYQLFGLTRGQWLSVGMLFVGGLFWYLSKTAAPVKIREIKNPAREKTFQKGKKHQP